ncbi:MAG: Maf family nucleotide pyrophosphatase [Bacteroidales bacterium]|nr:Maf family nucleotide pyrophosphatase [Bacteroidales bacterium]
MLNNLNNKRIILGSNSPRRHFLLKGLDLKFDVIVPDIDEVFPENLKADEICKYLSIKKSEALEKHLDKNTIIITADTIVWLNNKLINKPINFDDAFKMLQQLSNNIHEVYTGVTIKSINKTITFTAKSKVHFNKLDNNEINYYLKKYQPFDKAGSYGIQEWIGYIGIKKIEGSFYNVMGLPVSKLYNKLKHF